VNLITIRKYVVSLRPIDISKPSIQLGQYGSLETYIDRMQIATIAELLQCIVENEKRFKTFQSGQWKRLEDGLGKNAATWEHLKAIALGDGVAATLLSSLMRVRNKVSFHYDSEELLDGYRLQLQDDKKPSILKNAYFKHGDTGLKMLFYFADSAAQGYTKKHFDYNVEALESLKNEILEILPKITHKIFQSFRIVTRTATRSI
jgi:hypothetical protein